MVIDVSDVKRTFVIRGNLFTETYSRYCYFNEPSRVIIVSECLVIFFIDCAYETSQDVASRFVLSKMA